MSKHNSIERETIAKEFLENIGNVIKRNRKRKNYTLQNLSSEIEVDQSTLSRYENGQVDIPASAMAYISYIFDFDLVEYTIRKQDGKHLSQIFKELVSYGEKPRKIRSAEIVRKPKYDRTDEFGNVIPTYPIPRSPCKHNDSIILDTEDIKFEAYITETSSEKQLVLTMTYHMLIDNDIPVKDDLRTVARAATRYIASDDDQYWNRFLKDYLDKCKNLYR